MMIDLTETTTGAIHEALTQARRRLGGPASGMVLTLIIVTDEAEQYDAVRAANQAGREHPSRILAVISRKPKSESRLDAEIRVGETGPGETILLRMYGLLGQHADSVVAPLLAPDVPVVTWWPDEAPPAPSVDPLGTVAQRRVTDAAASDTPQDMLLTLAKAYKPGDTDLSWTRATSWRTLLAATLDQPYPALLAEQAVHAQQDRLAGAGLAHPDLGVEPGLGLGPAGDDGQDPARVLAAGLAGRPDRVILLRLVGDDDQREYRAGGGPAHPAARLGERLVDRAGSGVGQVDGHRSLPLTALTSRITGAAMLARPVPSSRRPTGVRPSRPGTVRACRRRPRNLPPGRGCAS